MLGNFEYAAERAALAQYGLIRLPASESGLGEDDDEPKQVVTVETLTPAASKLRENMKAVRREVFKPITDEERAASRARKIAKARPRKATR